MLLDTAKERKRNKKAHIKIPRATKEAQQKKMHDKKVLLNTQDEPYGVQKRYSKEKEQKATKADNVEKTVVKKIGHKSTVCMFGKVGLWRGVLLAEAVWCPGAAASAALPHTESKTTTTPRPALLGPPA